MNYVFFFQFILEPVPVEKEGDLPVLLEPLLACLRQERYIYVKDLYIWQYPMTYENAATLVRAIESQRLSCRVNYISVCTGVPVYLAPWTGCPPGGKPTMVGLPPGGQPVPGYPTPHPGYLHPRGATYPGWFILPPGGEVKPVGLSCPPPMNLEQ